MTGAAVLGVGMSVPDRAVTNADLEQSLDTTDDWIVSRTGIRSRRIAESGQPTSVFAIEAGQKALAEAGLPPADLDLILVATCTPDYMLPGSAPVVQAGLGAGAAGAMDVNAGCNGFVAALALAEGMVSSGAVRNVLVCGADTMSRLVNWSDRNTAVLFGDGAGAVVLGQSETRRVGPFTHGCDGNKVDMLYVPAGGSQTPTTAEALAERKHTMQMRGQDVYKAAVEKMTEAARTVLGDKPASSVDLVVAHQANARIIRAVANRLGLDEQQVVVNVDRYGNTSAASIPIALTECVEDGRLQPGMRVLVVAFGAGFAWGAGLIDWGSA